MEHKNLNNQKAPKLDIGYIIASFLSEKAKQYQIEKDKLVIVSSYGEIRLMRYDEGAYKTWKHLETINEGL